MIHRQLFYPPDDYVGRVYGYCRVSHKSQFDKGNSIEDQEQRIRAYVQMRQMEPEGPFKAAAWSKAFSEPMAQSAFSKPLRQRPAGGELLETLKPGDHLVIDKIDRMVRDTQDWLELDRWFIEHGVRLHVVSMGGSTIDTGTVMGKFIMTTLALHGEFESMIQGERVRLARASLRARKLDSGVGVPSFCMLENLPPGKLSGAGSRRVFRPWAIELFKRIEQLIEVEKLSFYATRKQVLKGTSNPEIKYAFNQKSLHAIQRYYWFWKAWNESGCPDINEIKFGEFVRKWRQKKGET